MLIFEGLIIQSLNSDIVLESFIFTYHPNYYLSKFNLPFFISFYTNYHYHFVNLLINYLFFISKIYLKSIKLCKWFDKLEAVILFEVRSYSQNADNNNYNSWTIFPIQFMLQQGPHKAQPYSLLASMYQSWQEYKIPAVYYHYLLSVLPKLEKKQQMLVMAREIKSLKANTHPYHKIINSIQARERSLQIIKQYVNVFTDYQSTEQMDWPHADQSGNTMDLDFETYKAGKQSGNGGYKVQHQDPRSPILSPSLHSSKNKQSKLQQMLNHLKLYQRLTAQIITMINEWQQQLRQMGYKQTIIQFLYHKQDYIQRINIDTTDILDEYQHIFENNPFLMMKRIHQKSQFALVYKDLKFSQDMLSKIHESLNIIAQHQADILKERMLAKVGQTANRKRIIVKSTDIGKIYNNYNNGRDYIVIKDSETMKKSVVLHQPALSRNRKLNDDLIKSNPNQQSNSRLKQLKNSILINPQARLLTIDRTVRKHPVQSNLLNLMYNHDSNSPDIYLKVKEKDSAIDERKIKSEKSGKNRITSGNKIENRQIGGLKRSLTEDEIGIKRSASVMLVGDKSTEFSANLSGPKFRERVEVKPVHRQNQIFVGDRDNNNREDQLQRNKGLSAQRKLEMLDKVNTELKMKNKSISEQKEAQIMAKISTQALPLLEPEQSQQPAAIDPPTQLAQSNQITLTFEQNIKQTQIVKYLREKVFKTSPQISFDEIQTLAKKLLVEKQYVTFIRVECRNMSVAWMAVKFMEKDNTMRRSVFVIYVRKFVRLSGFQRKLLDSFVQHGYGMIRNEQKILFEVDLIDIVVRPLIKIKYKVNPTLQKTQLKKLLKKHQNLSQSRLLKYHSYSKTSKYHSYCQHQKTHCQISYNFLELSKICIERNRYIRAKADKIIKLSQGLYRISSVVNETDMIVANTLTDIIALQKEAEIQKDSSFQQGGDSEGRFRYFAIKETKFMKKYVNQDDQAVLCEFVTINGAIPEVRSIAMTKQEVKDEVLILEPPFFMAIMTRDVAEVKTLAVIQFT